MSTGRKIASNTLIQLLGKVITTASSMALVAMLTRILGEYSYGEFSIILGYVGFFNVFTDLGVNTYLIKQLSQAGGDDAEEMGTAFGYRLITTTIFLGAAYMIAQVMPYSDGVKQGISIALLATYAQSINSLFVSLLQAKLEMKYATASEVIGRCVTVGLTAWLLYAGYGVIWAIISTVAGAIANLILTWIFSKRFVRISIHWNPAAWKTIFRSSMLISLIGILGYIYFKVDGLLLSALPLSGGRLNTIESGIYTNAYKVLEILMLVPTIFLGNVFPALNFRISEGRGDAGELLEKAFNTLMVFALPCTAVLFVLAPEIVTFVAGDTYLPAGAPLRILSFALLFNFFSVLFSNTLISLNKLTTLLKIYVGVTLFNLGSNLLLIPHYSYMAAASTTLVTEVLVCSICMVICLRNIRFRTSSPHTTKVIIVSLLLALEGWLLRGIPVLLSIGIISATYIVCVFGLRIITPKDILGLARPQAA